MLYTMNPCDSSDFYRRDVTRCMDIRLPIKCAQVILSVSSFSVWGIKNLAMCSSSFLEALAMFPVKSAMSRNSTRWCAYSSSVLTNGVIDIVVPSPKMLIQKFLFPLLIDDLFCYYLCHALCQEEGLPQFSCLGACSKEGSDLLLQ